MDHLRSRFTKLCFIAILTIGFWLNSANAGRYASFCPNLCNKETHECGGTLQCFKWDRNSNSWVPISESLVPRHLNWTQIPAWPHNVATDLADDYKERDAEIREKNRVAEDQRRAEVERFAQQHRENARAFSRKHAPIMEAVEQNTQELRKRYADCKKDILEKVSETERKAEFVKSVSDSTEKVIENLGQIDEDRALDLAAVMDQWNINPTEEAVSALCAIDQLTAAAEHVNLQQRNLEHEGSPEFEPPVGRETSKTLLDLARGSLGISLDDVTIAAQNVGKDSAQLRESLGLAEIARELGVELADLAAGLTPGVNVARDFYEAFTGRNLISGKELSLAERSIAALCVGSLGVGSEIKGAAHLLERALHSVHFKKVAAHGLEIVIHGAEKMLATGAFVGSAAVAGYAVSEALGPASSSSAAGPSQSTREEQKATKRFNEEMGALVDMAKKDKKVGISADDMEAYKELNKELGDQGFPPNRVRGPEIHPNRPHGKDPHGHVGPVDHIPIN